MGRGLPVGVSCVLGVGPIAVLERLSPIVHTVGIGGQDVRVLGRALANEAQEEALNAQRQGPVAEGVAAGQEEAGRERVADPVRNHAAPNVLADCDW